jgi:hypothetical protein
MMNFLHLFLPLVISNILHMAVVKYNLFSWIKIPVNVWAFGRNKTYRGFVVIPLFNSCFHYLLNGKTSQALLHGALYGLAYTICELPNSFIKRRMKINSGERSEKHGTLQFIMDKTDSALGVAFMNVLLCGGTFELFLVTFLLASGIHMSLSLVIYKIGLKESV